MPEAGWYDDGSGQLRYWDGQAWTDHFAPPAATPTDATPTEATPTEATPTAAEPDSVAAKSPEPVLPVAARFDAFIANQWSHHRLRSVIAASAAAVVVLAVGTTAAALAVAGSPTQPQAQASDVASTDIAATPTFASTPSASPSPSASPTTVAAPTEPFTVLGYLPTDGRLLSAKGFYVNMNTTDGLDTYSLTGDLVGSAKVRLTACAGLPWVGGDLNGRGHIVAADVKSTAAAGLKAETWDLLLRSFDPVTYQEQWATTLASNLSEEPECPDLGHSLFDGSPLATATSDMKWLGFYGWVVNLATGDAKPQEALPLAIGDRFALYDGLCANCLNGMDGVPLMDPATGKVTLTLGREYVNALANGGDAYKVSSDNKRLVISAQTGDFAANGDFTFIRSVSLVDGSIQWERRGRDPFGYLDHHAFVLLDEAADVVIADDATEDTDFRYVGLDLSTGKELYGLPVDRVCESRGTSTVVVANNQVVFVEPRTGIQQWYTTSYDSCGESDGSGTAIYDGTIVQVVPGPLN